MPRRRLLALLPVLLATAGCGEGAATGGAATGRFGALHTEVCTAAAQAEDGDLAGARATFDDVHVGLHDLAAAAGEEDRAVAARLLEAKQRAETGLSAATLADLVGPVRAAVEATGGTAPDNCP